MIGLADVAPPEGLAPNGLPLPLGLLGDIGDAGELAEAGLLPKGFDASLPKVRAGGGVGDVGDVGAPNVDRAGVELPNGEAGEPDEGDDVPADFTNSPNRAGGGSCLLDAGDPLADTALALAGAGTGERSGADAGEDGVATAPLIVALAAAG